MWWGLRGGGGHLKELLVVISEPERDGTYLAKETGALSGRGLGDGRGTSILDGSWGSRGRGDAGGSRGGGRLAGLLRSSPWRGAGGRTSGSTVAGHCEGVF